MSAMVPLMAAMRCSGYTSSRTPQVLYVSSDSVQGARPARGACASGWRGGGAPGWLQGGLLAVRPSCWLCACWCSDGGSCSGACCCCCGGGSIGGGSSSWAAPAAILSRAAGCLARLRASSPSSLSACRSQGSLQCRLPAPGGGPSPAAQRDRRPMLAAHRCFSARLPAAPPTAAAAARWRGWPAPPPAPLSTSIMSKSWGAPPSSGALAPPNSGGCRAPLACTSMLPGEHRAVRRLPRPSRGCLCPAGFLPAPGARCARDRGFNWTQGRLRLTRSRKAQS